MVHLQNLSKGELRRSHPIGKTKTNLDMIADVFTY